MSSNLEVLAMPLLNFNFVARIWPQRCALKRSELHKRGTTLYEPTVDNIADVDTTSIDAIAFESYTMAPLAALRPTVLLADDHSGFLERICKLLSSEFDVLGTTNNGLQAVSKAVSCHPDVVVLDVSMPQLNGLEAVLEMRKVGVSSKLVMLTVHQSADYVSRAFENGADGFVFKSRMNSELLPAIRKVLAGGRFVSLREN